MQETHCSFQVLSDFDDSAIIVCEFSKGFEIVSIYNKKADVLTSRHESN